jgi:hypothetical protein
MTTKKHTWNFSTIGGMQRVVLTSGADLIHISQLDPKLWTALSCPTNNLEIDKKTLELIDEDKDGQIRVPEIINAVNWVTAALKKPDDLLKQQPSLALSSIDDTKDLGKNLLDSAKIILKSLGKENADSLTVEETSDIHKIFANTKFNGDGIITEDSSDDEQIKKLITEIIQCVGSELDRGGKQGIAEEQIKNFVTHCEKYSAWQLTKENDTQNILPFGANTEKTYQLFCHIKSKVDDFFMRCRLAAFDKQSTDILNLQIARVETITAKDISTCIDEIATYPLAKVEANAELPLITGINPAWDKSIKEFKTLAVDTLFQNKETISEDDWNKITQLLEPYKQWISAKEGALVEQLGIERIKEILSQSYISESLSLIEQDKELADEANNIILVDKLVRYHRDIFTLLKNFVTFYDFYTPGSKAIFQAGTLYIDQRSCDLCIKVSDMGKHSSIAGFSGMFLIYCECKSRTSSDKMTIVAALTNGDIDNIIVGKNALFYDREGNDWDATVIKIIDNPISIRQAFFSPYRKVSRFLEAQINKVASSQDEKITTDLNKGVESNIQVKSEEAPPKPKEAAPFDVGKFVGIFAAIGLAIGAISTAIVSVVSGFLNLAWWKMPIAIAGLLLFISGPAMIMAYLKLRKRNLAPILDANGWAINARAIVNIYFGNTLTHLAELPTGAKLNLNDPFTKKKSTSPITVLIIAALIGAALYTIWKLQLISF